MPPVHQSPDERARKSLSLVLQRMSIDGTQRNLAVALGVSESTISRQKEPLVCDQAPHLINEGDS